MNKPIALIVVSGLLGAALISGAVMLRGSRQPDTSSSPLPAKSQPKSISPEELAAADGLENRPCYVAVDGVVYEIKNSLQWQNGRHIPSEGKARCGLELSAVIDQSPHGRKQLDSLPQVGRLSQ